jgi:hypothetical protein
VLRAATVFAIVCAAAWCTAPAGAAPAPHPAIDLMTASPNLVGPKGGAVVVRVKVEHAVRCAFRGQRVAFSAVRLLRTVDCHAGRASLRIPVAANHYKHSVTLHFSVTASDRRSHTDYGSITVVQAAKPTPVKPTPVAPLAVTTQAVPNGSLGLPYSVTLDASGGTGPYAWTIASGTLPPGVALSNLGELAGTPTAPGQFSFTLEAADAAGRTATVALSIAVADAHLGAAPDAPTENSSNWSGYAVSGGPFTSASGTFNVPTVSAGSKTASAAEWVGIDGWGPGASSIIQAGVAEDFSPVFGSRISAWYELYPAPAFEIPLAISAADQVTVSISQVSPGQWDVLVKDDTSNQSLNSEFSYSGAATTAEWIVEAPFSTVTNSVIPLLPFTPVTFNQLTALPTGQPATRFVMFQDGQQVSTPSPLSDNGFTVSYGGITPGAP